MRPWGYEQPADLGAVDRPRAGTERTEDQAAEAAQLCSQSLGQEQRVSPRLYKL